MTEHLGDDIVDVNRLAELLELSVPTVRGLIKHQLLPVSRVGRKLRISWPLVHDRISSGQDFTPGWWIP